MIIKGYIELDSDRKTVSVNFDNGSYCIDHFTHAIKRFLDEEIEILRSDKKPKSNERLKEYRML